MRAVRCPVRRNLALRGVFQLLHVPCCCGSASSSFRPVVCGGALPAAGGAWSLVFSGAAWGCLGLELSQTRSLPEMQKTACTFPAL